MINPYNPDLNKISYAYNHLIDKSEEIAEPKRQLFARTYKTSRDVIDALGRGGSDVDILSKMDLSLRKNPEEMMKVIERTPSAYAYAHQTVRDNPDVCDVYREEMLKRTRCIPIDGSTKAMQLKHQFSKNANFDQIFSDRAYEQAFKTLVQEGPYLKNGALKNEFAVVSMARMMRERDIERLNQIERDVWMENQNVVRKLAHNDRNLVVCDHALQAIEERCPELQPVVKQEQKAYWKERESDVLELMEREEAGQRLLGEEGRMIREALKHIELDTKKRRETEHLQKERNDNDLVYKRGSALDSIRTADDMGEIARGDAANSIAHIEYSTPTTATVGAAKEYVAHAESIENNHDNIDRSRENYLDNTASLRSPSMIPETAYTQGDAQPRSVSKEVMTEIELDEIVDHEYDELANELEQIEEEIETEEIDEIEEEYVDWKHSYSDDKPREHVWQ